MNNKLRMTSTTLHEGWHANQSNLIKNINVQDIKIQDDILYMKYNNKIYTTPKENFVAYKNLFIERDARNIGENVAKNLINHNLTQP